MYRPLSYPKSQLYSFSCFCFIYCMLPFFGKQRLSIKRPWVDWYYHNYATTTRCAGNYWTFYTERRQAELECNLYAENTDTLSRWDCMTKSEWDCPCYTDRCRGRTSCGCCGPTPSVIDSRRWLGRVDSLNSFISSHHRVADRGRSRRPACTRGDTSFRVRRARPPPADRPTDGER